MPEQIASEIRWHFRRVRQEERRKKLNQSLLAAMGFLTGIVSLWVTKEGGFLFLVIASIVLFIDVNVCKN